MNDIDFHILIERDNDLYSALCLELDLASQGDTIQEAKQNIREAVELYLESAMKAGEEEDVIPRPAPTEEWLKYFAVESGQLKTILTQPVRDRLRMHAVVRGLPIACSGFQGC